jgi:hypothetical protein
MKLVHADMDLPHHGELGRIAAVEKILDSRTVNGSTQYLVKWHKLSKELNSWVKHDEFIDHGPIRKFLQHSPANIPKTDDEIVALPKIVALPEDNPTQTTIPPRLHSDLGQAWRVVAARRRSK